MIHSRRHLIPAECLTPMGMILNIIESMIIKDMAGQVIECSNKRYYVNEPGPYPDENVRFLVEEQTR